MIKKKGTTKILCTIIIFVIITWFYIVNSLKVTTPPQNNNNINNINNNNNNINNNNNNNNNIHHNNKYNIKNYQPPQNDNNDNNANKNNNNFIKVQQNMNDDTQNNHNININDDNNNDNNNDNANDNKNNNNNNNNNDDETLCIKQKKPEPLSVNNIGFAFVILTHNMKTMLAALDTIQLMQGPRNCFVIHVDRKVSEGDIKIIRKEIQERGLKNVKIFSSYAIEWGGRELIPVALEGIHIAIKEWNFWHYLFLLSGDCLPIKPLSEIQKTMVNFYPYNNLATLNDKVEQFDDSLGDIKKARFKLGPGQNFNDLVKGIDNVYFGTTWVTLTREFLLWVLDSDLARNFLIYISVNHVELDPVTGYPSIFEESYFHTLIMHSPFKNLVDDGTTCIRYERWDICHYMHEDREVPCMLGELDIPFFNSTSCLFARKFVYNQLPSIITDRLADKAE